MFTHRYSNLPPKTLLADPTTFAVITFNGLCEPSTPGVIHSGLQALSEPPIAEVWQVPGAQVSHSVRGNCHVSETENLLCAAVWATAAQCKDIKQSTYSSYAQLLEVMASSGYIYPLRFWNYIPQINRGEGDSEEYKKFCEGRLQAFSESGLQCEQFPAASALGHSGEQAVFYVFAARQAGQHFENPDQERAYRYPREYGKSRPSFARATALDSQTSSPLFISGTASIIGHQTLHLDATHAQLETTLQNIYTLLTHTQRKPQALRALKVYIRDPAALGQIKQRVATAFPDVPTLYTRADICRANLLVEIEAHCQQ